jgi:hypothetical protein
MSKSKPKTEYHSQQIIASESKHRSTNKLYMYETTPQPKIKAQHETPYSYLHCMHRVFTLMFVHVLLILIVNRASANVKLRMLMGKTNQYIKKLEI